MISDVGLVCIEVRGEPGRRVIIGDLNATLPYALPRDRAEPWLKTRDGALFHAVPFYTCWVCGGEAVNVAGDDRPPHNLLRCERHADRNPCCIEGCKRSVAAPVHDGVPHLADDQAICGTHWRRYVPAGSRLRRTYHAHFRRAKRRGWTHARIRAFERFWDALVRTVRRRSTEGHLDEAEIKRLFGWADG